MKPVSTGLGVLVLATAACATIPVIELNYAWPETGCEELKKAGTNEGIVVSPRKGSPVPYQRYHCLNGQPDGELVKFYEDGTVERTQTYKDGKLNGEARNFYKEGSFQGRAFYRDGEQEGLSFSYQDDGDKVARASLTSESTSYTANWDEAGKLIDLRILKCRKSQRTYTVQADGSVAISEGDHTSFVDPEDQRVNEMRDLEQRLLQEVEAFKRAK